jgi:hypothetical protein
MEQSEADFGTGVKCKSQDSQVMCALSLPQMCLVIPKLGLGSLLSNPP